MENLFIKGKYNFPEIRFDYRNGIFGITGRSHPENADIEFEYVLDWIERYIKSPKPQSSLIIDLEYFNSTSAKILIRILELFTKIKDNTELKIKWYYYDDDTLETIEDFQELIDFDIEIIEKEIF